MATVPTPKELIRQRLDAARKAAFGPVWLKAMNRGTAKRQARLAKGK